MRRRNWEKDKIEKRRKWENEKMGKCENGNMIMRTLENEKMRTKN